MVPKNIGMKAASASHHTRAKSKLNDEAILSWRNVVAQILGVGQIL